METIKEVKKINPISFDSEVEKTMMELEKTRCEFWNLDRESASFLNFLIKTNNSKNVLEIGTSNGYSGLWILEALKETKGRFSTIEFWEKRQSVARANFENFFPNQEIEPRIGSARIVLEDMVDDINQHRRQKFDFVFIDANKKEYIEYFLLVDKMLQKGGIIVADNILSHYEKVEDFINLLFDRKDYHCQILELGTGMMLARKSFS